MIIHIPQKLLLRYGILLSVGYLNATLLYAQENPFFSPPLYTKNQISQTPTNIPKPNVMLFIDDSLSMASQVGLKPATYQVCNTTLNMRKAGWLPSAKNLFVNKNLSVLNPLAIEENGQTCIPLMVNDNWLFGGPGASVNKCQNIIDTLAAENRIEIINEQTDALIKIMPDIVKQVKQAGRINTTLGIQSTFFTPSNRFSQRLVNYLKNNNYQYTYEGIRKVVEDEFDAQNVLEKLKKHYSAQVNANQALCAGRSSGRVYPYFKNIQSEGTRIEVTRKALNTIIDKYGHDVRWNLYTLWGSELGNKSRCSQTNDPHPNQRHPYTEEPEEIRSLVNRLSYLNRSSGVGTYNTICDSMLKSGTDGTPATQRYLEAARIAKDSIQYFCQKNFIVMFSDGEPMSRPSRLLNIEDARNLGLDSSYTMRNGQLLSLDRNSLSIDSPAAIGFFSQQLFNKDLKPDNQVDNSGNKWKGKQNIQTYTIGFGTEMSASARKYLEAAATPEEGEQGFFSATNTSDLMKAFDKIFEGIKTKADNVVILTGSTASPATVTSQDTDMAATLTLDTGIWGSQLLFHELDSNGQPKKSNGKYISHPAQYTGRKMIMRYKGANYSLNGSDIDETVAQYFGFEKNEFNKAFLPWLRRDGSNDNEIVKTAQSINPRKIQEYRVRPVSGLRDANNPALGSYTPEDREMGDVLASPVISINNKQEIDVNGAKRDVGNDYVLTGANDGLLYIFKATGNQTKPYDLKLNYLPGDFPRANSSDTLASNLFHLAEANYGEAVNPHIYGVNGGISYVRTGKAENSKRHQQVIMVGAIGQGGRGVYSLNVSGCDRAVVNKDCQPIGLDKNENQWTDSVPLWSSKAGDKNINLGYTVGKPVLYQVNSAEGVRLAAFVSNGYAEENTTLASEETPTLYIYDALGQNMFGDDAAEVKTGKKAGSLLKKISVSLSDYGVVPPKSAKGKGALAPPAVVDVNFDGVADVVYAGDYLGNLYRFNVSNPDPEQWTAHKIYQGSPEQPITAAPSVYRQSINEIIVVFGTGSDLFDEDMQFRNENYQQGFFGIFDDLSKNTLIQKGDLVERSFSESNGQRFFAKATQSNEIPKNKKGWWFRLAKGQAHTPNQSHSEMKTEEKVVTQPSVLLSTVFFSTRIYTEEKNDSSQGNNQQSMCSVVTSGTKKGGDGWIMSVDVKTGSSPETSSLKIDISGGSGTNNDKDKKIVAGQNAGHLLSELNVYSRSTVKTMPSALNKNGQAGNGELITPLCVGGDCVKKECPPNHPECQSPVDCVKTDDYMAMLSQANLDDPLKQIKLNVKLCPTGGSTLTRMNIIELK